MSRLSVGKSFETKVNYRKLLNDLRDAYPHDVLETLVIETFANSLDADARHVKIDVDSTTYRIMDDGRGMSEYEFREYHNIASLTKERGSGGIGFAGVGAKIYLDKARYIYTETKSRNFHGASRWRFYSDVPRWEVVAPKGVIDKTGTFVEIGLNLADMGRLTQNNIIKYLQTHYNAALLGFYSLEEVKVNNRIVHAWEPKEIENRRDFELKIGRHKIKGFFIKSKNEIPEVFQGISIAVCGKTVVRNEWFKQFASSSDKIFGLILADHLISIVNTSKTQITKTNMLWRRFHAKISRLFSKWLEEIGAKITPPEVSPDTSDMIKELEKSINKVLLNSPELINLTNMFFQNIMRRITAIKSEKGELLGKEVEGGQKVPGTLGGKTKGSMVQTIGPEAGKGVVEDDQGRINITRVRRRMRSGIRIGFLEKPDDSSEGWLDEASQTVTVNTGHPAYKIACGLCMEMRAYHVWIYHLLRVITRTISKEVSDEESSLENKILTEWYENFIDDAFKQQINKLFP